MKRKQFEIWIADLNPTKGSEQKGIRPVVILETNAGDSKGKTTIIAPLTTNITPVLAYDVLLPKGLKTGLSEDSKIKMRQLRVIDVLRLQKKIGVVPKSLQKPILSHLALVFDFSQMFAE